ncbi:MAG: FHA domain-containing protein [Acidimicrobiia bacterium]
MVCARCGHVNPDEARFCSSCGVPLAADDDAATTLTLAAVEAADVEDELERYLEGLPPGVGLLVIRRGPETGSSYRLEQPSTAIGRHPDSEIFLDDITVSRRHVQLVKDDEGYLLRDVGSLNGTYVNRERVEEARLQHGDEVQVGRYRLSFVLGGGTED